MVSIPHPDAREVVAFWREAGPRRWFAKDEHFDAAFARRFMGAHEAAASGRLALWSNDAEGALALLILLDQFPRNAWRGQARAWATDALALQIARQAVDAGFDHEVAPALRPFVYLPFMHSESLADQKHSVELNAALDADTRRFAAHHCEIVERFGRFPHRNAILGRISTPEEQRFLDEGGFRG